MLRRTMSEHHETGPNRRSGTLLIPTTTGSLLIPTNEHGIYASGSIVAYLIIETRNLFDA